MQTLNISTDTVNQLVEMEMVFKPGNVARYPRLDTVLMVEKAVYGHRSNKTAYQIWRSLPKKVMWRTFLLILDSLEHAGKIHVEKDKTVTWIWDPEGVKKVKKAGVVVA